MQNCAVLLRPSMISATIGKRNAWANPGMTPNCEVAAIACGFNDLSYFNRCFRRRFGLTPTAARGK